VVQLELRHAGPLQPMGRYLRRLPIGPTSDTVAALATPPAGLPNPLPLIFVIADDRLIATTHGKAVTAENPKLLP
jgi:hypothetical protein